MYTSAKALGQSCWLEIYAPNKSPQGMEDSVRDCEVVLAIVSEAYLSRPFSVSRELALAQKHGKRVQPVIRVKDKDDIGRFKAATGLPADHGQVCRHPGRQQPGPRSPSPVYRLRPQGGHHTAAVSWRSVN